MALSRPHLEGTARMFVYPHAFLDLDGGVNVAQPAHMDETSTVRELGLSSSNIAVSG